MVVKCFISNAFGGKIALTQIGKITLPPRPILLSFQHSTAPKLPLPLPYFLAEPEDGKTGVHSKVLLNQIKPLAVTKRL